MCYLCSWFWFSLEHYTDEGHVVWVPGCRQFIIDSMSKYNTHILLLLGQQLSKNTCSSQLHHKQGRTLEFLPYIGVSALHWIWVSFLLEKRYLELGLITVVFIVYMFVLNSLEVIVSQVGIHLAEYTTEYILYQLWIMWNKGQSETMRHR